MFCRDFSSTLPVDRKTSDIIWLGTYRNNAKIDYITVTNHSRIDSYIYLLVRNVITPVGCFA